MRDGGHTWLGSPRPLVTPFVHGHVRLCADCLPCKDHLETIVLRYKVFGFSVDESLVAVLQHSCGYLLVPFGFSVDESLVTVCNILASFGICDCGSVMYTVTLMHIHLWLSPSFRCFPLGGCVCSLLVGSVSMVPHSKGEGV